MNVLITDIEEWKHPKPDFPKEFFDKLIAARPKFRLAEKFTIPVEEAGKAFVVKKGQSFRIICVEGAQIVDVCLWNANDYKERLWAHMTLNREGIWIAPYTRLWSNMPKFRPMVTCIADTVVNKPIHPGARHHYVIGAHCNPPLWYSVTKDRNHPFVRRYNCYCNLTRAIKPFGLKSEDLHGNMNLFMKCWIDHETGLHPWEVTDVKPGDYMEFYAEMDTLVAASICPSASGSYHFDEKQEETKPIGIEIYDTGFDPPRYEVPEDVGICQS
jgi:uncharacterized protein YcgI (DUF1989 family)